MCGSLLYFRSYWSRFFFATLNFNHEVLYAPSDYRDDEGFLRAMKRATIAERVEKVAEEAAETNEEELSADNLEEVAAPETNKVDAPNTELTSPQRDNPKRISEPSIKLRRDLTSFYLAEELAFRKLASDFRAEIQRGIRTVDPGAGFVFDGFVVEKGVATFIEVKVIRSYLMARRLKVTLYRFREAILALTLPPCSFRILLVVVIDGDMAEDRILSSIGSLKDYFPVAPEIRLFKLKDLMLESGLTT